MNDGATTQILHNSLLERLTGWVDGYDRHDNVSTWVARELIAEAIKRIKDDDRLIRLSASVSLQLAEQILCSEGKSDA